MLTRQVLRPRHPRANAFTLIELLVVVAVITLLISILLPSLSEARHFARTVKCAAQMRSIGLGMNEYATEWDGAILGNAHTSNSFMVNPPQAPATVPTIAASYWDGTQWQPLSNLSCPYVCQIWDWTAPMAKEMNFTFDEARTPIDRAKRFVQLNNNPAFVCPENNIVAASYASANWNAPTTKMLSFNTSSVFQYVYDPADTHGTRTWWDLGYSDVVFPGYTPKINNVGNASQKIFIADGARWSADGITPPDVNLDYSGGAENGQAASPGGHYADYGPWSTYSRAYQPPNGRAWAMRHGTQSAGAPLNAYKFNAVFFDGHAETLDGLTGANPSLWVPSGAKVLYDACFPEVQRKYFSGGTGSYLTAP